MSIYRFHGEKSADKAFYNARLHHIRSLEPLNMWVGVVVIRMLPPECENEAVQSSYQHLIVFDSVIDKRMPEVYYLPFICALTHLQRLPI
jgi:hypothetical protein